MIRQIPSPKQIQQHNPTLAQIGPVYHQLLDAIRAKELSGLCEPFIAYYLEHYIRTQKKIKERLLEPSAEDSTAFKQTVRFVRAQAHPVYGVFEMQRKKRQQIYEAYCKKPTHDNTVALLQTHPSTKERLPYYPQIQQWLQLQPQQTKKILDIGAGLQPFATKLLFNKVQTYDTIEVSDELAQWYQQWSTHQNLTSTHIVTHFPQQYIEVCPKLKQYDIILALKFFDVMEQLKRHSTVKLLQQLRTRVLIASFNLTTIKGDVMRRTTIGWFEKVIRQLNYVIERESVIGNEKWYVVRPI